MLNLVYESKEVEGSITKVEESFSNKNYIIKEAVGIIELDYCQLRLILSNDDTIFVEHLGLDKEGKRKMSIVSLDSNGKHCHIEFGGNLERLVELYEHVKTNKIQ